MSKRDDPAYYRIVCCNDLPYEKQLTATLGLDLLMRLADRLDFVSRNPVDYSINISLDFDNKDYYLYVCDEFALYYFVIERIVVPFMITLR